MATIYECDSMALFVDDLDPTKAHFLDIEELKIPSLVEKTGEHSGGGASMAITFGRGIFEVIDLTFKLRGLQPEIMPLIALPGRARRKYTMMGNVRDLEANTEVALKVVIEGRMTKVDMGSFSRDNGISTDFQVSEVVHYEFWLNGIEKYYLNYFGGPSAVRVDGVPVYQTMGRNLGLL